MFNVRIGLLPPSKVPGGLELSLLRQTLEGPDFPIGASLFFPEDPDSEGHPGTPIRYLVGTESKTQQGVYQLMHKAALASKRHFMLRRTTEDGSPASQKGLGLWRVTPKDKPPFDPTDDVDVAGTIIDAAQFASTEREAA